MLLPLLPGSLSAIWNLDMNTSSIELNTDPEVLAKEVFMEFIVLNDLLFFIILLFWIMLLLLAWCEFPDILLPVMLLELVIVVEDLMMILQSWSFRAVPTELILQQPIWSYWTGIFLYWSWECNYWMVIIICFYVLKVNFFIYLVTWTHINLQADTIIFTVIYTLATELSI